MSESVISLCLCLYWVSVVVVVSVGDEWFPRQSYLIIMVRLEFRQACLVMVRHKFRQTCLVMVRHEFRPSYSVMVRHKFRHTQSSICETWTRDPAHIHSEGKDCRLAGRLKKLGIPHKPIWILQLPPDMKPSLASLCE